jgi:hypothetical protein
VKDLDSARAASGRASGSNSNSNPNIALGPLQRFSIQLKGIEVGTHDVEVDIQYVYTYI